MTRRKRPPDIKRGRHKKHVSQETHFWNETHLIPTCPPWMDPEAYRKLVQMRNEQENPRQGEA